MTVGELSDELSGRGSDAEVYLEVPDEGGNWRKVVSVDEIIPDEEDGEPVYLLRAGRDPVTP